MSKFFRIDVSLDSLRVFFTFPSLALLFGVKNRTQRAFRMLIGLNSKLRRVWADCFRNLDFKHLLRLLSLLLRGFLDGALTNHRILSDQSKRIRRLDITLSLSHAFYNGEHFYWPELSSSELMCSSVYLPGCFKENISTPVSLLTLVLEQGTKSPWFLVCFWLLWWLTPSRWYRSVLYENVVFGLI